ncbi:hypothetical protein BC834DRAFT_881000 [Gloeopeniophorella convolvens]|nr:hypothetical protein BC834DRAFT_881000 [Gloeopeniophorella convolvens]
MRDLGPGGKWEPRSVRRNIWQTALILPSVLGRRFVGRGSWTEFPPAREHAYDAARLRHDLHHDAHRRRALDRAARVRTLPHAALAAALEGVARRSSGDAWPCGASAPDGTANPARLPRAARACFAGSGAGGCASVVRTTRRIGVRGPPVRAADRAADPLERRLRRCGAVTRRHQRGIHRANAIH